MVQAGLQYDSKRFGELLEIPAFSPAFDSLSSYHLLITLLTHT